MSSRNQGSGCPYCSGNRAIPGENDLATLNPSLAAEWHPTKNNDLTPRDVACGSSKKVWWLCSQGHEWKATISDRNTNCGCPYCANRKILPGYNDLATKNPKLAKQWSSKNNIQPTDVSPSSSKKVWWICEKGHEWQATVNSRNGGRGCPYCASQRIWSGFNDLASQNPSLAAEWHPTKNGDLTPQNVTCSSNRRVWWECSLGHEWEATINHRNRGENCPYCAGKRILPGFNDLATLNPKLAAEWHPTKNGNLTPQDVGCGTERKIWWQCSEGHEWQSKISNRNQGKGCPYCASSHGEDAVTAVLNDLNIPFLHDKPIKGCQDKGLLRHDFILLSDNRIIATIEFHGKQHYEPVAFHAEDPAITEQNFKELQRRDAIKTQCLKDHNIPQLIIPYWDFDNIEQIIKEFLDSEEVAKSKTLDQDPIYIKN